MRCVNEGLVQRRIGQLVGQLATETLADKAGVARSQVDHFIDDVGVHPLHEIFQIQVDIVNA
ncbi:hypothetical protein D3C71_1745750 [compost metagenome]